MNPEYLNRHDGESRMNKELQKYHTDMLFKNVKDGELKKENNKRLSLSLFNFEKNLKKEVELNKEYTIAQLEYIFNLRWDDYEGLEKKLKDFAEIERTPKGNVIIKKIFSNKS
jgi:hypothetical protein